MVYGGCSFEDDDNNVSQAPITKDLFDKNDKRINQINFTKEKRPRHGKWCLVGILSG